jgi:hypothetical protein
MPARGAAVSVPAPAVSAAVRDDSIYDRMVAFAQADPRFARMARDLARERENFLFTPDDPEWARPAEQALRDYFESRATTDGPRVTAISCRSAGCEVQALGPPLCGGTPCELQAQRSPEGPVPDGVDPVGPLRADRPAGLPLRRQAIFGEPIGDRFGIIVTFSREAQAPPAGR